MSLTKAFVNQLIDFLQCLSRNFPERTDIRTGKNTIETIEGMNDPFIVNTFMYYIHPFWKEVLHRNEQFFTDPDNLKEGKEFNEMMTKNQLNLENILQFRDLWWQLSTNGKRDIWKYTIGLTLKGSMIMAKKEPKKYTQIMEYARAHPELFKF